MSFFFMMMVMMIVIRSLQAAKPLRIGPLTHIQMMIVRKMMMILMIDVMMTRKKVIMKMEPLVVLIFWATEISVPIFSLIFASLRI